MTMQFDELVKRGEISPEAAHNFRYGKSGIHAHDVDDLYHYIRGFMRTNMEDTCQEIAGILGIKRENLKAYADYLEVYVSRGANPGADVGRGLGCSIKPEVIRRIERRNELMDTDPEAYERIQRRDYLTAVLNDSGFERMVLRTMRENPTAREWILCPEIDTSLDDQIRIKELMQKQQELRNKFEAA